VPEAPRCVCLGFERVCAKTCGAPMTISHFSRWAVTLLAAGYKFPAKFGRNFDGANAGSRSSGRRERAHPTAKLLRV
jgi:hypothetical protein